jgi:hypothetical protein
MLSEGVGSDELTPAHEFRTALGIVLVTVGVALSVLLSGIVPPGQSGPITLSFAPAEAAANRTAAWVSGGPWSLASSTGLDLRSTYPATLWPPDPNCTVISGSATMPAFGGYGSGYAPNSTEGEVPDWFFFYVSPSATRELAVLVADGFAEVIGVASLGAPGCRPDLPPLLSGHPSDSTQSAAAFDALPAVQAYLRNFTPASTVYQPEMSLNQSYGVGPPRWGVLYSTCSFSTTSDSGNGGLVQALLWSSNDTVYGGSPDYMPSVSCAAVVAGLGGPIFSY